MEKLNNEVYIFHMFSISFSSSHQVISMRVPLKNGWVTKKKCSPFFGLLYLLFIFPSGTASLYRPLLVVLLLLSNIKLNQSTDCGYRGGGGIGPGRRSVLGKPRHVSLIIIIYIQFQLL